jgi:PST family polysaccharide transporter
MTIPLVGLQIQMRHRTVALVGLIISIVNPLLSIWFAYKGYGAYAFVLPLLITGIMRVILLWVPARLPLHFELGVALWPQIMSSGLLLLLARAFGLIIGQTDYLLLGWMYREDDRVLGVYYFAFNLSMQTVVLLVPNLDGVLLPTLSKLQGEPDRQRQIFMTISKAIAFLGFPICFLQAALSGPGIRLFFDTSKWLPAIPVLALLSIGMAFRTAGWAIHSLIPAQGRYRLYAAIHGVGAVAFVALVFVGGLLGRNFGGGAVAVAVAVSIYFAFEAPITMLLAIRRLNGTLRDIAAIFVPPLLLSAVTIGIGAVLGMLVPDMPLRDWVHIAVTTLVGGGLFMLGARWFMPEVWRSIGDRAAALLRRRREEAPVT